MTFSDTPPFFSLTMSAVVRSKGLLSRWRPRMMRLSDSPALTDSITESTRDGAPLAAGFAAGAAFGAALGAAGVCPKPIPTMALNTKLAISNNLNFMLIPPALFGDGLHAANSARWPYS